MLRFDGKIDGNKIRVILGEKLSEAAKDCETVAEVEPTAGP